MRNEEEEIISNAIPKLNLSDLFKEFTMGYQVTERKYSLMRQEQANIFMSMLFL